MGAAPSRKKRSEAEHEYRVLMCGSGWGKTVRPPNTVNRPNTQPRPLLSVVRCHCLFPL